MKITHEINRLEYENTNMVDTFAQQKIEFLLEVLARCVPAELQTFDTIVEGFSKVINYKNITLNYYYYFRLDQNWVKVS